MKYDDILYHPYPFAGIEHKIKPHERAAQFMPFAALSGFDEACEEIARITDEEISLSDHSLDELNRKITFLYEHLSEKAIVTFTCFIKDEYKSGGHYDIYSGFIKKVNLVEGIITLNSGIKIDKNQICDIEGDIFKNLE